MKVVGLTGGIGSGKTTVAKEFKTLGIPVYIADLEAKKLMVNSAIIKSKLKELFGAEAYINDKLNKPFIADIIFKDKSYLEKMNAIVHPEVAKHFNQWKLKQKGPYVIKEVAILFENGGYLNCDFVITVVAPLKLRIERLLKRDKTTVDKIEAIMNNQWSDAKKIELSNFVIENINLDEMRKQAVRIHEQIMDTL
ncbi:dephospho-CoA kinase [Aestuariibaculum sediminum]|uniref:Dephospho-CoA kinase n=1 Tax=Aestuariibaculum sediminum TaxID=2770637 RepID=A0A8J6U959_9FLAO|nr:dephospho-CoA kinase [Aestuariibaculum sediminum]MBD0832637.1 dephospho-CoA kinase [Aestuariibaculum sediminum]